MALFFIPIVKSEPQVALLGYGFLMDLLNRDLYKELLWLWPALNDSFQPRNQSSILYCLPIYYAFKKTELVVMVVMMGRRKCSGGVVDWFYSYVKQPPCGAGFHLNFTFIPWLKT